MSTSQSAADEPVPPPLHVQQGGLTQAELDRIKLPKKRSHFRLRPGIFRKSADGGGAEDDQRQGGSSSPQVWDEPRPSDDSEDTPFIKVGGNLMYADELMEDNEKDVYRWAVLYENERGVSLFSTRYYSRLSLLPIDPPAFTLPSTSKIDRSNQPALTLSTYPLPDGSWRWVSRMWMVDMRGDGQTQYDGFEYNWLFRKKHWRAQTGFMSAGGWVRRRRWVRLMVRPAIAQKAIGDNASEVPTAILEGLVPTADPGVTRPPSVIITPKDEDEEETADSDVTVWQGSVEEDWSRCRRALMRLDRDGRKLEVWSRWLQDALPSTRIHSTDGHPLPTPRKQWTEDEHLMPSEHMRISTDVVDETLTQDTGVRLDAAKRDHVATVLRAYGADILGLFVYQDSRTHFVELVSRAGLLPDLTDGLGAMGSSTPLLDFWSSSQSLQDLLS